MSKTLGLPEVQPGLRLRLAEALRRIQAVGITNQPRRIGPCLAMYQTNQKTLWFQGAPGLQRLKQGLLQPKSGIGAAGEVSRGPDPRQPDGETAVGPEQLRGFDQSRRRIGRQRSDAGNQTTRFQQLQAAVRRGITHHATHSSTGVCRFLKFFCAFGGEISFGLLVTEICTTQEIL